MLRYAKTSPLIALHLPKCGGTSFRHVLASWFPEPQLLLHYRRGKPPSKHDLEGPVCVYGHFNSARDVGVEQYYPEVKQFITIMREPFDRFLAQWFYLKENEFIDLSFDKWIDIRANEQAQGCNDYSFVWHFPFRDQPIEDVLEQKFVFIGMMDRYRDSVAALSAALGKPMIDVPHLNASARITDYNMWRPFFERNFVDELEIYEKARKLFDAMIGEPTSLHPA